MNFACFLKLFFKFFGSGFKIRLHREKVSRRIAELFCCRPYPGDSFDYEVDQSFLYFITWYESPGQWHLDAGCASSPLSWPGSQSRSLSCPRNYSKLAPGRESLHHLLYQLPNPAGPPLRTRSCRKRLQLNASVIFNLKTLGCYWR